MDLSAYSVEKVKALYEAALSIPDAQIRSEPVHLFGDEVYGRMLFLPEGATAIGKVHLRDHICVVLGDITVSGPDGVERITGFRPFVTRAGAQRTVFAHTDTFWVTVHSNPGDSRDLPAIEAMNVTDDLARAALPGQFVKEIA